MKMNKVIIKLIFMFIICTSAYQVFGINDVTHIVKQTKPDTDIIVDSNNLGGDPAENSPKVLRLFDYDGNQISTVPETFGALITSEVAKAYYDVASVMPEKIPPTDRTATTAYEVTNTIKRLQPGTLFLITNQNFANNVTTSSYHNNDPAPGKPKVLAFFGYDGNPILNYTTPDGLSVQIPRFAPEGSFVIIPANVAKAYFDVEYVIPEKIAPTAAPADFF